MLLHNNTTRIRLFFEGTHLICEAPVGVSHINADIAEKLKVNDSFKALSAGGHVTIKDSAPVDAPKKKKKKKKEYVDPATTLPADDDF